MSDDRFDSEHPTIPANQIDLPAGFSPSGERVRLRQLLEDEPPALVPTEDLNEAQKAELTRARIERQRHFEIATLREGRINKDRALAAIKEGSSIGAMLVDLELRAIDFALRLVEKTRNQNG